MTTTEKSLSLNGDLPILENNTVGNISKRRWKKMQNKEFRKLVLKKFGRPEHEDIRYVNFMLTEKHALIEITGDKITHKIVNSVLKQYPLGFGDDVWTFIESRPEWQAVTYWFNGELIKEECLFVRSFYRTDREDALAVLQIE